MNHLYFDPNFVLLGTALGRFSRFFFLIFRRRPTMVTDIFTQPVLKVAYKIKTESKGSRLVKLSYEFYHVVSFIQGSTMDQHGMTLSY